MKMIAHHAMGHDPHAAELFAEAQQLHEQLPVGVAEDKIAVHDARDAVVVGDR